MNLWLAAGAFVAGAAAVLLAAWAFLLALRYLNAIERRFGRLRFLLRIVDAISRRFPELFWQRGLRVGWMKGVTWHTSDDPVVGYVDRHSANPGESLHLHLSTVIDAGQARDPISGRIRGRIEVYRFTRVEGNEPVLWTSAVEVPHYDLNWTLAAVGSQWPPALTIPVGTDWKSGFYLVDFVLDDGRRIADLAYFVVTNPERSGDLVLKIGTTTYQAYNTWGGHSLYNSHHVGRGHGHRTRGQLVAFDRPTPITRFRWYDQYYIAWLESFCAREGIRPDYATGIDVHLDPRYTADYRLFVTTGHDEYWSDVEFDRVYRRIFEAGRNVLFLGANTAYWQVRYVDLNAPPGAVPYPRHLLCHKTMDDPIRWRTRGDGSDLAHVTSWFRDASRRPETMLMGVAHGQGYDGAWGFKYDYRVHSADFPFFRDTGLTEGDTIRSVIGHEWDKRDPKWKRLDWPHDRMWAEGRSTIALLPAEDIRLVLQGIPKQPGGRGDAEAVYFESAAGGKVFSAGTIAWGRPLGNPAAIDERFQKLNENLIRDFLEQDLERDVARDPDRDPG